MKTLKKAEQRNVILKKDYYTIYQLNDMLKKDYIFTLEKNININDIYTNDIDIRISLHYAKEIKVVLDNYGYYKNVVVMEDGCQYYINL